MPLVSDGRILIRQAFEQKFAMPAFNICSLEMASACIAAAELERAPIIIQTGPGDLEHGSPAVVQAMVAALANEVTVPVMMHLDHGDSLERVARCLRAGYSSVMLDSEAFPLEENIRRTRQAARIVHATGASLEAAAGSFGGGEGGGEEIHLTDPETAARLFVEGEADMVACSVGSLHGQPSRLDLDLLRAIHREAGRPLVLHGGSGIPAEDLAAAAQLGVVKVNIGAALVRALFHVWHEGGAGHYDIYRQAHAALVEVARDKIRIMGAAGKA